MLKPAGHGVAVDPGAEAVAQGRPVGAAVDYSLDGAGHRRGSSTRTTLPPLPRTRSSRWPCSSPRSPMSAPHASKIPQPT